MHGHGAHPHHPASNEPAAGHGMLVVGEQSVYLSHLPMFMSPHDYQVLLEATFTKAGDDPQAKYVADRQQSGAKVYTLPPESFVLPELVETGPNGQPRRTSFRGDVIRNHFERPPTRPAPVSRGVTVGVKNVIYFQKFDPDADQPPALTYLLFGTPSELFLAHAITSPPDFDHVLAAKVSGHQFTDQELHKAVRIVFPGRASSSAACLKEGERLAAEATPAGASEAIPIEVEVGTQHYLEINELRG
jgi:hypothetical protein